jgi:hypothetical protein
MLPLSVTHYLCPILAPLVQISRDGSAINLYASIQRILKLPEETRLFLCHDYKTKTRETFCWQTTVAEQKAKNVHVGGGKSEKNSLTFGPSGMRNWQCRNLSFHQFK